MSDPALIVIAKQPLPGRSKTRLTPPCTPAQAAGLAEAALADTLAAVARAPASRRVLALDGVPGEWLPPGFEVVKQGEGGLGVRLAAAFGSICGPALLVGMDTPQLTPDLLATSARTLMGDGVDAVLGPAPDGGYWAIGLRGSHPRAFDRVPMSAANTCEVQLRRLRALGLRHRMLPALRDFDTIEDAHVVASSCRGSRFAEALDALDLGRWKQASPRKGARPLTGGAAWAGG